MILSLGNDDSSGTGRSGMFTRGLIAAAEADVLLTALKYLSKSA